jgi:NAD(P) transhydrogenase subunit alpha
MTVRRREYMVVGIPRESYPGERRVSLIPSFVDRITKLELDLIVQKGAGTDAGFVDGAYKERGARIVANRRELFSSANIILQVRAAAANPQKGLADLKLMKKGSVLIGFLDPYSSTDMLGELAGRKISSFAMELIPRITRAQNMDALSSMASISGYRAALLAACALPRMYPMLITAAGTVIPARVFVIGAGVAGLQAIATAHRIGAVVSALDIRPSVKEQVQSLGAKFVELNVETEGAEKDDGYAKAMGEEYYRKQRELMGQVIAESDVVISTAALPGKKAPLLITEDMVGAMAPGSVVVDLAAEQGGNCECTVPGETVMKHGVTIMGPINLPSSVPYHASQLYSKNITSFLQVVYRDGSVDTECQDEIACNSLLTTDGRVVHEEVREALGF